jgi:hypothetical protein
LMQSKKSQPHFVTETTMPNKGLQATAYSLRYATASRRA